MPAVLNANVAPEQSVNDYASALVATNSYRQLFTRVVYTEWMFFALLAIGLARLQLKTQKPKFKIVCMAIAAGHVQKPTAIRLLIAQHAGDHLLRTRRLFADQPVIV